MGVRVRSLLLGLAALTIAAPAAARVRVEIISGTSRVEFLVTTTAHFPFIHSTSRQRAVDALEASLAEVRNLVSLDGAGRARLRVLRSGLRSKAAVFEGLLTGNDRERLDAILETWWQHLRARERFDGEAAWSDVAGEIAYAVHYRDESFLTTSAGQRISCLRIALDVDASASFETVFDGLSQKLRPSLCRHEAGDWRLH